MSHTVDCTVPFIVHRQRKLTVKFRFRFHTTWFITFVPGKRVQDGIECAPADIQARGLRQFFRCRAGDLPHR